MIYQAVSSPGFVIAVKADELADRRFDMLVEWMIALLTTRGAGNFRTDGIDDVVASTTATCSPDYASCSRVAPGRLPGPEHSYAILCGQSI